MDGFWHDFRYSLRTLLRSRAYTTVAVLTLALGIGINTAIFSFSKPFLFPPLPFGHPDRIAMIWTANPTRGWNKNLASLPDLTDWKAETRTFEDLAASFPTTYNLTGAGSPAQASAFRVSGNYFDLLEVRARLGRMLLPEDDQIGRQVAVLGHGFWQRRFGGDAGVVGRTVELDGSAHTIVGVAPEDYWFPTIVDLWTPLAVDPRVAPRDRRFLFVVGRLRPEASMAAAFEELGTIAQQLEERYPDTNAGWIVRPVSVAEEILNDNTGQLLTLLLVAVGFVLLIACMNVANLTLARSQQRRREMAARAAMGASRWRLMRQLLAESLLLAIGGGAFGLLAAYWGMRLLVMQNADKWPLLERLGVDQTAVVFTFVISAFSVLASSVLPARSLSNLQVSEELKEGSTTNTGGVGRRRFARGLVVAEVALALPLLVVAGLSIRTMIALQHIDWGFQADHVLTMRVALPQGRYEQDAQAADLYERALSQLARVPDVQVAAATSRLPAVGGRGNVVRTFSIEGRPVVDPKDRPWAVYAAITPDYLRAMAIPVVKGRPFTSSDTGTAGAVALVSRALVRRYFPADDAIGSRIALANDGPGSAGVTIVGVVDDIRVESLRASPSPYVFVPLATYPERDLAFVMRTGRDPLSAAGAVRTAMGAVDNALPVYEVRTLEQLMTQALGPTAIYATMLVLFAIVAFALAVLGVYGLVSYTVSQRTHEIGVRMAIGAERGDIISLVVRQGVKLALTGMFIGLVIALLISRALSGLLYGFGLRATDPLTFGAVGLALLFSAVLACYIPARRSARVDPLIALRYE